MNKLTKFHLKIIIICIIIIMLSFVGIKSYAMLSSQTRLQQQIGNLLKQEIASNFKIPKQVDEEFSDSVKTKLEDLDISIAIDNMGQVFLSEDIQDSIKTMINNFYAIVSSPILKISIFGFAVFIFMSVVIKLILIIIKTIAKWKMYNKAGKPGWALLLPIYKDVLLLEIADLSPIWLLFYLAFFIPIVGPFIFTIAFFIIRIIVYIKISESFGKPGAFAIGLLLFPTIFYGILGFGKSEYKQIKVEKLKDEANNKTINSEVKSEIKKVKNTKTETTNDIKQ